MDFTLLLMTYNAQDSILATLDSFQILASSRCKWSIQLLVVDDHSIDNTLAAVSQYGESSGWLRSCNKRLSLDVYSNDRNLGVSENLANSLALASGVYTIFFGQDDLLTDDIFKTLDLIKSDLSLGSGVVPCAYLLSCIDEKGSIIGNQSSKVFNSFPLYTSRIYGEKLGIFNTASALKHAPRHSKNIYLPHSILLLRMTSCRSPIRCMRDLHPRMYVRTQAGFSNSNQTNIALIPGLTSLYLLIAFNHSLSYLSCNPLAYLNALLTLSYFICRSPSMFWMGFEHWFRVYMLGRGVNVAAYKSRLVFCSTRSSY